jgi:plasmid stabilization system protein ParE
MEIALSDKAKSDLFRIHRYIGERSPSAADAFIRRIDTNFENLARFPFIGRERSSLAPGSAVLWSVST